MEIKEYPKKIIYNGIRFIGLFLLFFSFMALIHSFFCLRVYIKSGSIGINHEWGENGTALIITSVTKESPASKAGLKVRDTIVQINGNKLNRHNYDRLKIWGEPIAGSKIIFKIKRKNKVIDFVVERRLNPLFDRMITLLFSLIMPLLMLSYVLAGLWGLIKSSFSFETILISIVCFSFGLLMYTPVGLPFASSPIGKYFYLYEIKEFLSNLIAFAPAFWLYLFLIFPQKNKFYQKHKLFTLFLIFSLPILVIITHILYPSSNISTLILLFTAVVYILLGIWILARASKRSSSVLQKRQLRLILFGLKFGGLSIVSGWMSLFIFALLTKWQIFLSWIVFPYFLLSHIGGLIIPFTFLNSFFHKKLLETENALKRKVRYIIATIILFLSYICVSYIIGKLIIENFHLQDPSLIIIFVLLIATTFYPLNNRIQIWLERKFYPEKTKYREALKDFVRELTGAIEGVYLLEKLSNWIERVMRIRPVTAFAIGRGVDQKIPFHPGRKNSVTKRIKDGSNFFWDEIIDENEYQINQEEKRWAQKNGVSITIPMISYGKLVGVLNVGQKSNKEDFSGADLEIIKEASVHTAIALQNIILQAESLEKKRLDKELQVARDIQAQLFPQEIPRIKGLQVYGKMRPCFEVGGDYFDMILIDENKMVLAVGDVSGKGAGAALLMANLQAGLRSALRFSRSLPDILFEINNIVNQNTNSAQFITFFVGIWDYLSQTFQYVNAGHNPPLLLKSDEQEVNLLSPTGMVLGVLPDVEFSSEQVKLFPGDVLAIYTDGIEETFNPQQEEFGVERITQILVRDKHLDPEKITDNLFRKVEEFSEGTPTHDDSTIIIAKVVKE
ncbi:MAG: SpoIIE family protein phosphatase [Candidatus Aminicenantes bacterium]|nr:SpoIIE family protein phosphatase [Candidatus Aminicenantes bacterium]